MEIRIISAAGVIQDTGEVLPDRDQMTPKTIRDKDGNLVCTKTGKHTCSSTDLCTPCAHALERMMAKPSRKFTDEEIEQIKIRNLEKWTK